MPSDKKEKLPVKNRSFDMTSPGVKTGFGRLLQIAGQKKAGLVWSCIFSFLSALMSLTPLIIIYLISNELLSTSVDQSRVWTLALLALGGAVARFLFQYISLVLSHVAAFDILYGLRRHLVAHLGVLPIGFFTRQSSGKIKKIINDDIEELELFIAHHIPDFVTAITLPSATLLYLSFKSPILALSAAIPLPFAWFAQKSAFRDKNGLSRRYHDALESMNSTIIDYVRGMPIVKIFNQTVDSFARFKESVEVYTGFCIKWAKKSTPPFALFSVMINSTLFFIVPAGAFLVIENRIDMSLLLLFLLLGTGYAAPINRVASYGATLGQINEGVKRIDEILAFPELPTTSGKILPSSYEIEFKNVSFSYGSAKVLTDLNLTAASESITALVGPSGAGKTTIAELILRFQDVDEGEITIGGINVKDIPHDRLMEMISFVFQDTFLFEDTIRENIRMGKKNIPDDEVIKAAKLAQAHGFISSLTEGYNTVFGAKGCHLSGGEKQRIALARAILKDAPIVILDEATAFADPDNELEIQKGFVKLMTGKTVIVIAHRLSTIRNTDQILVINEGVLIEKGNHLELLKKGDLYKDMWEAHIGAKNWKLNNLESINGR